MTVELAILLILILNTILSAVVILRLNNLEGKEEFEMATLQEVLDEVTSLETVDASAIALISGLASQVKNLQPNQAAIDELANKIEAEKENMAAAIVANTPVVPQPPAPPTPADNPSS